MAEKETKIYKLLVETSEEGQLAIEAQNLGFLKHELLGILEIQKARILKEMFEENKIQEPK